MVVLGCVWLRRWLLLPSLAPSLPLPPFSPPFPVLTMRLTAPLFFIIFNSPSICLACRLLTFLFPLSVSFPPLTPSSPPSLSLLYPSSSTSSLTSATAASLSPPSPPLLRTLALCSLLTFYPFHNATPRYGSPLLPPTLSSLCPTAFSAWPVVFVSGFLLTLSPLGVFAVFVSRFDHFMSCNRLRRRAVTVRRLHCSVPPSFYALWWTCCGARTPSGWC